MNILIIAATDLEINPLIAYFDGNCTKNDKGFYLFNSHTIYILTTGVGVMQTTFAISQLCFNYKFDVAINLGISGTFDRNIQLGGVVEVVKDRIADLGIEEASGQFIDVFEMNLINKDIFPYQDGWVSKIAKGLPETNLKKNIGITVNKVTGTADSTVAIQNKYKADVESMEGAAFFYTCAKLNLPSIQVRAISNYVEPRNRDSWKMQDAIQNLYQFAITYLKSL
jgi:futalosine hydrolase